MLEARKQSVVASLTLATTMYHYGTSMLRSIPSIHDDVQRLLLCTSFLFKEYEVAWCVVVY